MHVEVLGDSVRVTVCASAANTLGIQPGRGKHFHVRQSRNGVLCERDQRESRESFVCAVGNEKQGRDRKSTRLNSSHSSISYAVFCLKKKKKLKIIQYNESNANNKKDS